MPCWALLYLAFLCALTAGSAAVDWRARRPRWRIAVDVSSMAVWAGFVIVYFHPALAETLGRWTAGALIGALAWTGAGVNRDIAALRPDPSLSARANAAAEALAIVTAAVALAPAVTLALIVVHRVW